VSINEYQCEHQYEYRCGCQHLDQYRLELGEVLQVLSQELYSLSKSPIMKTLYTSEIESVKHNQATTAKTKVLGMPSHKHTCSSKYLQKRFTLINAYTNTSTLCVSGYYLDTIWLLIVES
jgi:hypothetical protein